MGATSSTPFSWKGGGKAAASHGRLCVYIHSTHVSLGIIKHKLYREERNRCCCWHVRLPRLPPAICSPGGDEGGVNLIHV